MRRFEPGDRVRIDIPDETDPDHDDWHGVHGVVVDIIEDDAGQETGDSRDSHLFGVETSDGEIIHLRWRDLRPAVEE
jgi:hypothetical protein